MDPKKPSSHHTSVAPPPAWIAASGVLAAIGFGLSLYSLIHHLQVRVSGSTDASCNINATINCDAVAMSPYAEPFLGIPLGVFGMGFFIGLLTLLAIGRSNLKTAIDHKAAYGAFTVVGVLASLALGSLSWFSLGLICLVCFGIYGVCLLLAGLVWAQRQTIFAQGSLGRILNGTWSGAIAVLVIVIGFQFLKPYITPHVGNQSTQPQIPALAKDQAEIPLSLSAYSGLGEDYRKGSDQAKVVIHEFADFQCPACKQASQSLEELSKEYGSKILIVFRNYPLDNSCNSSITNKMHDFACSAAVFARCGGQYGKFWQAHDLLFQNQMDLNEQNFQTWATKDLGLTEEQWGTCQKSPDILNKIKDDVAIGNKIGVDSTPTILINGRKVLGRRDRESLKALIDEELNR